MSEGFPAERFSIATVAPKPTAALIRFGHHPDLDPTIHELVALRASQLNGCADRAGVPDDVWADARAHFDEPELAQLLCAIAATNTWNRLQIATRALPGHYPPSARETAAVGMGR